MNTRLKLFVLTITLLTTGVMTDRAKAQAAPPAHKQGAKLVGGAHSDAERLIEFVYSKLNMYNQASRNLELKQGDAAKFGAPSPENERDDLRFEIRNVRSGPISEIVDARWSSLVAPRSGRVIQVVPHYKILPNGIRFIVYDAHWVTVTENRSIVVDLDSSVGYFLHVERGLNDVSQYIAYEVTAELDGDHQTYNALALIHGTASSTTTMPSVVFFDSVLGPSTLEQALAETNRSAPSHWERLRDLDPSRLQPGVRKGGGGAALPSGFGTAPVLDRQDPASRGYSRLLTTGFHLRAPNRAHGMMQGFLGGLCDGGDTCCVDGFCCEEDCNSFDPCGDILPYCYIPPDPPDPLAPPSCKALHKAGDYTGAGGFDTADHVCNANGVCAGQHEWGDTLTWSCDRRTDCSFACNVARKDPLTPPYYKDTGGIATFPNSHVQHFQEADVGGPVVCNHSVGIAVTSCLIDCSVSMSVTTTGVSMQWSSDGIWTATGQYVNDCKANLGVQ